MSKNLFKQFESFPYPQFKPEDRSLKEKEQCIVVGKQSLFQKILNNIKNVNDNINDITRIIEYIDEDF